MNKQDILTFPVGSACGAVRHDHFFKTDRAAFDSIMDLAGFARGRGMQALLEQEYPDTGAKNIIVNVIDGWPYVIDGNRHCAALLMLKPDLSFGELEALRPGLLRIWFAGVEPGKNSPAEPYEVYIPADVDISSIPGARPGTDYFKDPPAPTNIVPADFPADSELLSEQDRGRPLAQTVISLLAMRAWGEQPPEPSGPKSVPESEQTAYEDYGGSGSYGPVEFGLPCALGSGNVYISPITGDLLGSDMSLSGRVGIPRYFQGQTVTVIGTDAFNRREGISSVHFPDSLRSIGNAAFYGCSGLSLLTLPGRLESIGDDAFGSCAGLLSVTCVGSRRLRLELGGGAFAHCPKLSSVTFLGEVGHIGDGAFYDCEKLMSIIFNGSLASIGANAFSGCGSLMSISLPAGLESIGNGAFARCEILDRVEFRGTREQWEAVSIGQGNECLTNAQLHFHGD